MTTLASSAQHAAHVEAFIRRQLQQHLARFEVDAVFGPGCWPAFRSTFDEQQARATAESLLAQGFGWVRLRLVDELHEERFEPLVLLEKGQRP